MITPRGRRPILTEDHAYSKPWRKAIKVAIQQQIPDVLHADHVPISVPIAVIARFYFERLGPTAQLLDFPVVNAGVNANGDVDKLLRNLLDAMKDARLIVDDSLVVDIVTSKRWANEYSDSGIHVKVEEARNRDLFLCSGEPYRE
ncbi:MAG TPA: RusA family crossover junction endodeoxyribonuclease [Steroidobacteraceae bacterium]